MKILIFGGGGYIGNGIINYIKGECDQIIDVSLTHNFSESDNDIHRISIDILDEKLLHKELQQLDYDIVINCTGNVISSNLYDEDLDLINNHLITTRNIMACLNWDKIYKFLHIGSAKEYGNFKFPIPENIKSHPTSLYGYVKLASTEYVLMRSRLYNLPTVIIRPFFVYGNNQKKGLIPYIIKNAQKGKKIQLAHPDNIIDLIHIDDVARGVKAVIDSGESRIEVYNLGSGQGLHVKDIAKKVCEMLGNRDTIKSITDEKRVKEEIVADFSKATKYLNWRPSRIFPDGIEEMIKDYYL